MIHKNSVTYFSNPLNRIYVVGKNMVSIVICIIRHQKIYSLKFFPWNFHLCIEILHIEVYCSLFCLHFTSDGLFLLLLLVLMLVWNGIGYNLKICIQVASNRYDLDMLYGHAVYLIKPALSFTSGKCPTYFLSSEL